MSLATLPRLSPAESRLLALALPLVAGVRLALWVLPSRTLLRWVRGLAVTPERAAGPQRPPTPVVVWAVEAAAKRIPRATCLTQAVAVQLLFRRYGYGAHLILGVGPSASGVRAHAWVERDGRVLIGGPESQGLVRLPELASARQMPTPRRTIARRETPHMRERR